MSGDQKIYLTPRELAALLRVSRRRVIDWMRAGKIPGSFKIGREWRVSRWDWDRFLSENKMMIDPSEAVE